ncbi:MarR family transcriptional regulator [Methanolobus sp. WCC4]|uniref:MarR family winged helix-turn-helix transcriptional regulator n=1 Tax=Methanolobus sp. WCC4 TaxID=3125784 RepID=UPI0030F86401
MVDRSGEEEADVIAIVDGLVRLINKAVSIEKEPVDIGHGIILHSSEVHLIDMAGRYSHESVSQLACRLGITKGAVSQTAKKLEDKGYIRKEKMPDNKKTVVLSLTEMGQEAFEWHKAYHEAVNAKLCAEIEKMSLEEKDKLNRIFISFEEMMDNCSQVRDKIKVPFHRTHSNK